GEDGEREVPRADADHGAERRGVGAERIALVGVVAEEIDGLADFGDGVGRRLAGFSDDKAEERGHLRFEPVGGGAEDGGAVGGGRAAGGGGGEGAGGEIGGGELGGADDVGLVGGIGDGGWRASGRAVGEEWGRGPRVVGAGGQRVGEGGEHGV